MGDRAWARRVVAGDRRAGERLVAENYLPLYRMLRGLTRDADAAQDLVQQTFVHAWAALPEFRGEARLSTWLHRIAYREYTRWLRARRVEAPLTEAEGLPAPAGALSLNTVALDRALAALPDPLREAFILCHVWRYTCREAGAILEVPAGTVKSRLFEARSRLREILAAALSASPEPGAAEQATSAAPPPVRASEPEAQVHAAGRTP